MSSTIYAVYSDQCPLELRSAVDGLSLSTEAKQLLLFPAYQESSREFLREVAVVSYDPKTKSWTAQKTPSLPSSRCAYHVCIADYQFEDVFGTDGENASFEDLPREERSEAVSYTHLTLPTTERV